MTVKTAPTAFGGISDRERAMYSQFHAAKIGRTCFDLVGRQSGS